MNDDRITLIVSDLHVGGGPADAGDDHVYHNNQLVNFVRAQGATPEGLDGRLELFFNGDFLEFAQTDVKAFSLVSDKCWCTEVESLRKLETILKGHPEIFEALRDFQKPGNVVTIAAGNHDVDLYWAKVQARLREVAGAGLRFEIGQDWIERYDGKLQVGHGHMSDVANRFENWAHPVVTTQWGIECLEMCPGTLFMVKFVNKLEAQYPFADNLLPVTKLASVLLRDDKSGFASVGWMFTRLVATTSPTTLGTDTGEDYGTRLLGLVQGSRSRAARLAAILQEQDMEEDRQLLAARALTQERLASLMFALLGRLDMRTRQSLFDLSDTGVDLGTDNVTLAAIVRANLVDGKIELKKVAKKRGTLKNASVVVMGHTHQADELEWNGGKYYNPGCWTRYLELEPGRSITLEDLKEESKYPYALNFVRVERQGDSLASEMVNIDQYVPPCAVMP